MSTLCRPAGACFICLTAPTAPAVGYGVSALWAFGKTQLFQIAAADLRFIRIPIFRERIRMETVS